MQQDEDWTYTRARHETPTDHMKASPQGNKRPETTNDFTVSTHATNTKQNNIAVVNKADNGASTKSPTNADNKQDANLLSTMM